MRLVGAHLSISGGLDKTVDQLIAMGGNCLQIFSSGPRSWAMAPFTGKRVTAVQPVFIHAKYLINLGSDKPDLLKKSIACLKHDLQVADLIGAKGVIVHLGSHLGRGFEAVFHQVTESIKIILKDSNTNSSLIIENSAGQQGKLCSQLSEIRAIFNAVNSIKLAWCLDTCHAWGAGLSFGKGLENNLQQFDLVKSLVCLHVNDSKGEFGSGLDRHENLGEGKMGREELGKYVNFPAFKNLPLITEAPGFDGQGPDKKNLDILKSLCA